MNFIRTRLIVRSFSKCISRNFVLFFQPPIAEEALEKLIRRWMCLQSWPVPSVNSSSLL